jgi:hypothetical protein
MQRKIVSEAERKATEIRKVGWEPGRSVPSRRLTAAALGFARDSLHRRTGRRRAKRWGLFFNVKPYNSERENTTPISSLTPRHQLSSFFAVQPSNSILRQNT